MNLILVSFLPTPRPFPWLSLLLFISMPLLLLFFAKPIAATLHRGLMERFASDRHKPQSPQVIMFLGWIVLVSETIFLMTQLAAKS